MLKAFIFDLDGVIVDTARFHYYSWVELTQELGFEIPASLAEDVKGLGRMESLELVLKHSPIDYDDEQKKELAAKKNAIYLNLISHIGAGDTLPGVDQFLDTARKGDLMLAVGSGSKNARPILHRLGITDKFNEICDGTDTKRSKPDPEVFQCAMSKLRVEPSETVVFEDAVSGVQAAKTSGAFCVGIGDPEVLGKADVVYSSFDDFTVNDILNQFS